MNRGTDSAMGDFWKMSKPNSMESCMRYEGQIYSPFSEANSYLLQCTFGCSHNQCTFCGMYKDKQYRLRSLEEIKDDIKMAKLQ